MLFGLAKCFIFFVAAAGPDQNLALIKLAQAWL
jgi:hypothetical protein